MGSFMSAPLMFTLMAALCFGASQTLLKKAFSGQPPLLVIGYALLSGAIVMFALHFAISANRAVVLGPWPMLFAVLTGAALALGNFAINRVFASGGTQATFTAIYVPSLLVLGVLAGVILSGETLNLRQILGLAVTVGGVLVYAL